MNARDLTRLAQLAANLRWRLTAAEEDGSLPAALRCMVDVAAELSMLASAAAAREREAKA